MSELERRLEAALRVADSPFRRQLKKLTKERQKAEERFIKAVDEAHDRERDLIWARKAECEAQKLLTEQENKIKDHGRIEYNHKVRNR